MLRYDDSLWRGVSAKNPRAIVLELCRPSVDSYAGVFARIIEGWADRYALPRDLTAQLTSSVDDQFWAGFFHLEAGRLFVELGFDVNFKAKVGQKTPDLLIEKGGLAAMVEVFTTTPSVIDREETDAVEELQSFLRARLDLPNGSLSLSPNFPMRARLDRPSMENLASEVERLVAAEASSIRLSVNGVGFHGFFIPKGSINPVAVFVGPAGAGLDEAHRIYRQIGEKVSRYAPYVTDKLGFIIVAASSSWKVTSYGLSEALYGAEQITVDLRSGEAGPPTLSGQGAAVVGAEVGYEQAAKLWGTLYLKRGFVDESSLTIRPEAAFLYNPYADNALPPDTFAPLPEQQVDGTVLRWVRREAQPLVLS